MLAAVRSGSGKTSIATGLMGALAQRGLRVQGFKVGPDFIDPSYHTAVTGRWSRNLDTWMLSCGQVRGFFVRAAADAGVAVIEGVMGLFNGLRGAGGWASSAEVARLLGCPVVLVQDVRSQARSAVAEYLGCRLFDPELLLAGVILNRYTGERHLEMLQASFREAGIPVLGAIQNGSLPRLTERHLGLVPVPEQRDSGGMLQELSLAVARQLDLEAILAAAESAPYCLRTYRGRERLAGIGRRPVPGGHPGRGLNRHPISTAGAIGPDTGRLSPEGPDTGRYHPEQSGAGQLPSGGPEAGQLRPGAPAVRLRRSSGISFSSRPQRQRPTGLTEALSVGTAAGTAPPGGTAAGSEPVRVALAWDAAFNFYYRDGLDLLTTRHGIDLVPFSPLGDRSLPDGIAGVLIGGGFPESFARELAANEGMKDSLCRAHAAGMPIYAECGGFMYLCETLGDLDGGEHRMVGLVPGACRMAGRLTGMGYVAAEALRPSILCQAGDVLRGHEFHYSYFIPNITPFSWAFTLRKSDGRAGARPAPGLCQAPAPAPGRCPAGAAKAQQAQQAQQVQQDERPACARDVQPGGDGYASGSLLASYFHFHFAANPRAAARFAAACRAWLSRKMG
jgi:cobyrinic acid a,c-diamide synthase